MIPPQIHYVWVGSPLPPKQRNFIESWRATNPDYELIQWDETNIDMSIPLIRNALHHKQWSKVADIARLIAVFNHGGIYLDTDFKVLKRLDGLRQHNCFYGFQWEQHPTDWIANGAFGAVPGHWFIKKALDKILTMKSLPFGLDRPTRFGPKLITKLLIAEGLKRYSPEGVYVKDIFVCPTTVFYPFQMGEEFTPQCIRPETVAAHFWHKSWDKNLPVHLRVARTVHRRVQRVRALLT